MWNQVNPYHHIHFNEYSFDFFDKTRLKRRSYHTQIDVWWVNADVNHNVKADIHIDLRDDDWPWEENRL